MTQRTAESSSHPALSYLDRIAEGQRDLLLLIARVAVGWIYMQSGWGKLMDISGFAASMARHGLPEFMGYIAPPVEFLGGVAILAGFATRYAALTILVFTIVASFTSHAFWNFTAAAQRSQQSTQFFKNLTMTGGLLLLFISGPGRFSIDRMLRRAETRDAHARA